MKHLLFLVFFSLVLTVRAQCDSIPPLNKGILQFATSNLKKKVGRGECWDLAKFALDKVGAKWDGKYEYGRKLERTECILPGDIIQFEKIKIKYKKGNSTYTETMAHHTAIIFEVDSQDEVTLIHQNTEYSGRKVGTSTLKFSTIISGKYYIYRPQK